MKKDDRYEEIDEFEESEMSREQLERARILVKIIPFALIIFILLISLLVGSFTGKKDNDNNKDLQESIKEHADNLQDGASDRPELQVETPSPVKEETPSPSPVATKTPIEEEAEVTPTPYEEIMKGEKKDYSKISFDTEGQLNEMMRYWAENDQKALKELAGLDHYRAMSYSLRGTKNFYYYGDTDEGGKPNGTGIAVYADNQYYYGSWHNGLRSGKGTWFHFHLHDTENHTDIYEYHQYAGMWAGDLPEGEGSEHNEFRTELLKPGKRYYNNFVGSYKKGLINGDFFITHIEDEEVFEWQATAKNGSWVYQSENRDKVGRGPVYVDMDNPDNYVWMTPKENQNIGVPCLISSQKN